MSLSVFSIIDIHLIFAWDFYPVCEKIKRMRVDIAIEAEDSPINFFINKFWLCKASRLALFYLLNLGCTHKQSDPWFSHRWGESSGKFILIVLIGCDWKFLSQMRWEVRKSWCCHVYWELCWLSPQYIYSFRINGLIERQASYNVIEFKFMFPRFLLYVKCWDKIPMRNQQKVWKHQEISENFHMACDTIVNDVIPVLLL